MRFYTVNFGILIVCTDPNNFYECKEQAEEIYQAILDKDREKDKPKDKQEDKLKQKEMSNKNGGTNGNQPNQQEPKSSEMQKPSSIVEVIDKCTIQMYTRFNMKELQVVIIKNNVLNQYTTYNYPLLTQVNVWHQKCLKIFQRMQARFEVHISQTTARQRL